MESGGARRGPRVGRRRLPADCSSLCAASASSAALSSRGIRTMRSDLSAAGGAVRRGHIATAAATAAAEAEAKPKPKPKPKARAKAKAKAAAALFALLGSLAAPSNLLRPPAASARPTLGCVSVDGAPTSSRLADAAPSRRQICWPPPPDSNSSSSSNSNLNLKAASADSEVKSIDDDDDDDDERGFSEKIESTRANLLELRSRRESGALSSSHGSHPKASNTKTSQEHDEGPATRVDRLTERLGDRQEALLAWSEPVSPTRTAAGATLEGSDGTARREQLIDLLAELYAYAKLSRDLKQPRTKQASNFTNESADQREEEQDTMGGDEESLLKWLRQRQTNYSSLKNATFELLQEFPNRSIIVCEDGPKILVLPDKRDILTCHTSEQWLNKLWSDIENSLNTPIHYLIIILNVLIFLFGTTGNIFVCLSVYRNHQLRNVTNYFIVNLAFADLLVILICLPATAVWDLSLTWFFGTIPCKLIMFLQDVSISVSVLTLTAISLDRYYAICYPLKFKSNLSQAKRIIVLIWLVSLLIMAPNLVYLRAKVSEELSEAGLATVLYSDCNYDWSPESSRLFQFVKTILLYLLPFMLMFAAHFRILQALRAASSASSAPVLGAPSRRGQLGQLGASGAAGQCTRSASLQLKPPASAGGGGGSAGQLASLATNPIQAAEHLAGPELSVSLPRGLELFERLRQQADPRRPTSQQLSASAPDEGAQRGAQVDEHEDAKPSAAAAGKPLEAASRKQNGGGAGANQVASGAGRSQRRRRFRARPAICLFRLAALRAQLSAAAAAATAATGSRRRPLLAAAPDGCPLALQRLAERQPAPAPSRGAICNGHYVHESSAEAAETQLAGAPNEARSRESRPPSRQNSASSWAANSAPLLTSSAAATSERQLIVTMHNKSKLDSRRAAAKMLMTIVMLFGICYLPVHLINFLRQFMDDIPQTDVTSTVSMLAHCVCYLNSAINPIIYNHMNSIFRAEFKKFLSCLCLCLLPRGQQPAAPPLQSSLPTQTERVA